MSKTREGTVGHTAGPWTFQDETEDEYATIYGANGIEVMCIENFETAPTDADRTLMLAAPEMLEALKALFEHCAMTHKHWGQSTLPKAAIQTANRKTSPPAVGDAAAGLGGESRWNWWLRAMRATITNRRIDHEQTNRPNSSSEGEKRG